VRVSETKRRRRRVRRGNFLALASPIVSVQTIAISQKLNLRAGELVEVRTAAEILATLDADHCLEGLPFMPEMLRYCGKRFRVFKSAHKTCDTIDQYVIRRMNSAVHLEGLRCDGEAHGGCQAGCLLFFKEAWLKRVDARGDAARAANGNGSAPVDLSALVRSTRAEPDPADGQERFRCQATELLKATSEVRRRDRWDPRFYFKDLTSGNVPLGDFIRYGLFAAFNAFSKQWFGRRYPTLCGRAGQKTPTVSMNMQPGEVVQVRSRDEIMATLGPNMRNRGLFFDVEMTPFCEQGEYKVLSRVEKIVDEKTGRMVKLPNPCLILDGVTCSGNLSSSRMFCPRAVYPYWREIWLQRTDGASEAKATS